jgi:thiosulfate/3-mercaptopyruvate sulfurtransferase
MIVPSPLVSAQWLADNLDRVQPADVRWAMGEGPRRDAFESGHLPGAVFVDLDADLADPPGDRGRHPLPTPEHFARVRGRLGLVDRPVIVYDDQSGAQAGRLWWMLDAIGQEAAVLDGGIQAWTGELERGKAEEPGRAAPAPVPWPADRFIDAPDLLEAIDRGGILIDARSRERFAGEPNDIDPRPGHVPGARSRPWTENVGADGRFLPVEELRTALGRLGVRPGADVVASCGSGVTGCHDLLAARLIGVDGGRLYTGSWSEWAIDGDRPVAIGDEA